MSSDDEHFFVPRNRNSFNQSSLLFYDNSFQADDLQEVDLYSKKKTQHDPNPSDKVYSLRPTKKCHRRTDSLDSVPGEGDDELPCIC